MNLSIRMLAALALLLACRFADAAPAAMVTDVVGSVRLSESGTERPAALLSYVEPGTSFKLASGARLVLAFLSRPVEAAVTGPAEGTVGIDAITASRGTATTRSLQASSPEAVRRFEPVQRERIALATVQMRSITRPRITLEGPVKGNVYDNRPVLSWSTVPGAPAYRVRLKDESGTTLLDRTVASPSYRPEQPLAFGASYEWRVEAQRAGETLSDRSSFSMVDAGTAQRLDALKPPAGAPFSERVLFAATLQSEGLAYDAKREWRAPAAERDDPSLREWAGR